MSIAAINSSQYGSSTSMQAASSAASSVSADGTAASSSTTASSSMSSSTTVSSDLGSWLMSMGIGDDPAVQLMAALLTLAILQELLGEESEDSDSAGLLAFLGQGLGSSSFSFFSSSSSSTVISSTSYSGQVADVGGELDVTAGADTTVADGGTTELAPTEGPVLNTVA